MKTKKGRFVNITGINPKELSKWIHQDKSRWASIKCQALIALTNGVSVTEVCNVLNVTRESIRLWRERLKKEGPEGFIAHKNKGRKSYLTEEIKNDLQNVVLMPPKKLEYNEKYWDGRIVCQYLKKKWNIKISVRTAQNWLIKTGIRKAKRKRLK
ncbi:MAG: helix-turn-helix domain-containing protein [Bacteroidia bacterium]|nr:helix-turn-helix domain-containing protein [Bacteroidia bacterium]